MNSARTTQESFHSSKEDSTERHSDEFSGEFDRERKSIENEEHDNTTSRSTLSPRTKANCFPAAWLLLFLIVLIMVCPSAGVPCSDPTDIRLRNSKTGGIDCILCPECGQSQQYSIPCGSTVDIAPNLRCVDCPKGTFSEHFDKKPCKPCTICTNKVYKRNCTKDHNAICGSCLPGYRHDPIAFACNVITIKKAKTSSTTNANQTTSTTTAATTAKRATVITKQAATKGVTEPPPIPAVIFTYNAPQSTITDPLPTVKSQLPPIIEIKTYQPSSTLRNDSKKSGSPTNQPWIIAFAIASVICVVLSLLGVVAYIRRMKRAKSSRRIDAEMQPLNGKSTLLSQYMNDSKSLSHAKHGTICNKVNAKSKQNFKALVCGLGIQPDTVHEFYSQTQGKGDFQKVLETLISSKPELTLEGIAQECERQTFKDVANLFREEDKRFQEEKKDSNN